MAAGLPSCAGTVTIACRLWVALLHGSAIGELGLAGIGRTSPFQSGSAHAFQGQRRRSPPYPEAEADGDQLVNAYDASLRRRGSLTVWFTDEAIAGWLAAPRTTRGGQCLGIRRWRS